MALLLEVINLSFFAAALFLTVISVPKLLVLTIRYANKVWVLQHLDRDVGSRVLQMAAKDAYGDFTKSMRDPLIEASVAGIILFFLISIFSGIAIWLAAVIIIVLGIIVFGLGLAAVLWRDIHYEKKQRPQIRIP